MTFLDEKQSAAHLSPAQTKGRHQASTEVRPPWPKAATWLGPALAAGPTLPLETDHSSIALRFTPGLGIAVMMAQITEMQCLACLPSILVRGRATQIAQKRRTCIGLHRGRQCQYKVPSRQDRGRQVRHRDVDIQVNLLFPLKKKKSHLGLLMLVLQDRPHGDEMKVV